MDAHAWDERYAATGLVWSGAANQLVAQELTELRPGQALNLAAGEGRNALWLAEHGWQVTAVDFSQVGLDKGRQLAEQRGLEVDWVCADALTYDAGPEAFDLVLMAYLQLAADERRTAVRAAIGSLRTNGTFLLVAHDATNLTEGTGGPSDPDVLYTAEEVLGDLDGERFEVHRAGRVRRLVQPDEAHRGAPARTAYDAVVRLMRSVTPTQLRAFAAVVRLGSVKAAAEELAVSEAAVSMHVGQLRRELDDKLFTRASSGLAFTPGGLRLASRAVEILGLQDRTVREVSQAGHGRRLLRIAASSLFAEHAAPGLIDRFAARGDDLDVELSVRPTAQFPALLAGRTVDVAIGPASADLTEGLVSKLFLNYEVVAVAGPDHPMAGRPMNATQARGQEWLLGPSAVGTDGVVAGMLRQLRIPESQQRIFQSDAGALEETRRTDGLSLAVRYAVTGDLRAGRLRVVEGPGMRALGRWAAVALAPPHQVPATAELLRFITTPRATQAMVHGAGAQVGRFRPSVHVTLWS